jgi:dihydroorotate dehydrogenase
MLTIQNIDKIRGTKYSEALYVGGVKEWNNHYEFTLVGYSTNQIETILLHRRRTSDRRYIMEYKGHTLWVDKNELNSIDRIIECMIRV